MAVYSYCKACTVREERCLLPDSHRAQNKIVWCCDFLLGGAKGKRVRKQFKPGISKKEVEKFEHLTMADFERGTFLPTDKSKTLFENLLDRYFKEHVEPNTRNPMNTLCYINALKRLVGAVPIGKLTLERLQTARSEFKEVTESSNSNVNRCFSVLKTALHRGIEWGYLQRSPAEFLRDLPVKETIPRFLNVEEIARLRAVIKDPRLDDYVSILLHTGIRPIDLKSLDWSQVDIRNRSIQITTHKGRRPYTYPVPIDDTLMAILERRKSITGGVGRVLDTSNMRKLAEKAIRESRINEGRKPEEEFTIYGLKHCYASHLLMNGATIFDVAKLLGHTDTKMVVKHYGHLTQEHLRSVQSKINLTPTTEAKLEVI